MKTTAILSLGALAGLASANINFNWVNPTCKLNGTQAEANKCLTGQHCTDQNACLPDVQDAFSKITGNPSNTTTSSHAKTAEKRQTNYSPNGQCGPANNNMICDPNSTVYKGTCCSQYGWCGGDAAHCGTGCISGCTGSGATSAAAAPSSAPTTGTGATAPRSDGRCGTAFGGATCAAGGTFGGCCSQYGYCGSTTGYCLVSNGCQSGCTGSTPSQGTSQAAAASPSAAAPSAAAPSASAAAPRSDGRCGSTFGGATCAANGAFGGCCSAYGYCGSTTAHCLPSNGCQSGCTGASSAAASPSASAKGSATAVSSKQVIVTPPASSRPPSSTTTGEPVLGKPSSVISSTSKPSPTLIATTDGSCGSQFNNTVCGNWPQGSCCSMYGYCGSTSAHCGEGCQSGPCAVQVLPAPPAKAAPQNQNPGSISMAGMSGVPAMHAGLMSNGRVVFLDKVENYTQLTLPNGQYAYSSEWDPATQQLAPLAYKTNAFCSGGIFLADGTFISVGGNAPLTFIDPTVGDGFQAIRKLTRSSSDASLNGQAWNEPGTQLSTPRWYPSVQIMPNDQIFIASGSKNGLDPSVPANNNPTYEWLNADGTPQGVSTNMSILVKNQPYYMYPFMHLLNDGNLFVHVAKSSEIFNPTTGQVVAALPDLPGQYRTYPNTGGSVMLPLSSSNNYAPDIVICGGGPYQDITAPGDPSCGRIQPMSNNPQWEMDSMPEGRCMVEGTLLPDGTVIFLNGAQSGAQGFGVAKNPAFEVLIYDPNQPLGQRFTTGPSSTIARLYHSVSLLLPDGTVLISGSNPNQMPVLQVDANDPFPTEFQNEVYTPPYLAGNPTRPTNVQLSTKSLQANGQTFNIQFTAKAGVKSCMVSLYYGGYVTHSVHMGHRMVILDTTGFNAGSTSQKIVATMPPNKAIAPAGPYMVFVVCDGVPAIGQFVMLS